MCYDSLGSYKNGYAIVAQLDRAFGSDPEGQRFESSRSHQKGMTFLRHAFFLCLFLHAGVLSGPACGLCAPMVRYSAPSLPSAAPTSSPVSARASAASATPKPDHKDKPKQTPAPTSTAQPAAPTQSPRTGDNASLMTWVGILLVCGTALAGLYVYKKRKQK